MRKILSIDGGGIKGVFPASFLSSIEDQIEGNIVDYFDLVVGTSTGGIIALGLGMGLTAKDILAFYESRGNEIFKGNRFFKFLRRIGFSKYDREPLKKALESVFGNSKLGESKTRLVIPSFNLESGEVYIYKTAHCERFKNDYKEKVVDVALATSAAPTYFPVHTSSNGISLVDGGLWANNPMGMAAVEAVGTLSWPRQEIKMLSIGCTEEKLNVKHRGGILPWALKLADIFMASQSSASLGTAQHLLGHKNVKRINPGAPNGKYSLDTVKQIKNLKGLGFSEARKAYPDIEEFFTSKADTFMPEHKL